MSKYRGKKRKNEEYDLQTIMEDDDTSGDVNVEAAVPQASGRDAEKNDEAVNKFHNFSKIN